MLDGLVPVRQARPLDPALLLKPGQNSSQDRPLLQTAGAVLSKELPQLPDRPSGISVAGRTQGVMMLDRGPVVQLLLVFPHLVPHQHELPPLEGPDLAVAADQRSPRAELGQHVDVGAAVLVDEGLHVGLPGDVGFLPADAGGGVLVTLGQTPAPAMARLSLTVEPLSPGTDFTPAVAVGKVPHVLGRPQDLGLVGVAGQVGLTLRLDLDPTKEIQTFLFLRSHPSVVNLQSFLQLGLHEVSTDLIGLRGVVQPRLGCSDVTFSSAALQYGVTRTVAVSQTPASHLDITTLQQLDITSPHHTTYDTT